MIDFLNKMIAYIFDIQIKLYPLNMMQSNLYVKLTEKC